MTPNIRNVAARRRGEQEELVPRRLHLNARHQDRDARRQRDPRLSPPWKGALKSLPPLV